MTVSKKILNSPEYDFLKNNEHLGDNIILLGLTGSHGCGTANENSDVDLRGIALPSKRDLLCYGDFEQFTEVETDTVIYSLKRIVQLLQRCNPNTIELLGLKPEHYFIRQPKGEWLLANRRMFLSKRAINAFGDYANDQLRRLQNALARDHLSQNDKEDHIFNSLQKSLRNLKDKYARFDNGSIVLSKGQAINPDMKSEIFIDVNLEHYPIRDYKNILSELEFVVRNYDKLQHRNRKKDDLHLNKHSMHLVRLFLMGIDLLEKEDIITCREQDHELLMQIRNGYFQNEDGSYKSEFFDLVNDLEKKFRYAAEHTALPDEPDRNLIEDFVIALNEEVVLYGNH